MNDPIELFRDSTSQTLQASMAKIEHCLAQLDEQQIWWRPDDKLNSIANLLLHLTGNIRQWLVAGIQQQEDTRDRAAEFDARSGMDAQALRESLAAAVRESIDSIRTLPAEELGQPREIQGFQTTALGAIFDSVSHFVGHAEQIVYITRLILKDNYRFHWEPSPANM